MIRSVLVAGMHTEENQFVRYVDDMMLKWEHLPEMKNRHIPAKHDAVIFAASIASHNMFQEVKEVYGRAGKPVFLSKGGISEIKHDFESKVFGDGNLKIMRRGMEFDDAVPITHRVWWALGHLVEPGRELRLKSIVRFFDKFIMKGHDKAVNNVWYRGRADGCFEVTGKGSAIFHGVPEAAAEKLSHYNLSLEGTVVIRPNGVIVRPKLVTTPHGENLQRLDQLFLPDAVIAEAARAEPEPVSAPLPAKVSEENEAMMQLILETMSTMQAEIRGFKEFINARIPEMLRFEMKGINTLVGDIVPELADLAPDQLAHIKSMIDIMKMAYGSSKK